MSLKDVLVKPLPKKQRSWLEYCEDKLDAEDYQHLIEVIRNEEDFSAVYVANIMTKQGFPVSSTTILSTRRKLNG